MASPFLALPAELRAAIYEYVFLATRTEAVDLLCPDVPTKALSLISKQLYHETRKLYNSSCRTFWLSSAFTLDTRNLPDPTAARATLLSLRKEDINHITSLAIYQVSPGAIITTERTFSLINNRGGWCLTSTRLINSPSDSTDTLCGYEQTFRRYRPWSFRIGPGHPSLPNPTKLAWDGSKDEESLRRACEAYSRSGRLSVRNQVFDLLGWELEDLETVVAATYTMFGVGFSTMEGYRPRRPQQNS
ncbi:hypothetical protein Slin14017_G103360 [Septoria linicola]|nr:hypothetical protein Slin14017_G103360 [Septoria linicola]